MGPVPLVRLVYNERIFRVNHITIVDVIYTYRINNLIVTVQPNVDVVLALSGFFVFLQVKMRKQK